MIKFKIFQATSFCLMNQKESICRSNIKSVTCFENEIPDRFNTSDKTKDYCSFEFPPGYSIYVEEFIITDAGPNNFVLLDGELLEYSSKLKWSDRRNKFWSMLNNGHPLKEKSNRRSNFHCIKSLKVENFKFLFAFEIFHQNNFLRYTQKLRNLLWTFNLHHIAKII